MLIMTPSICKVIQAHIYSKYRILAIPITHAENVLVGKAKMSPNQKIPENRLFLRIPQPCVIPLSHSPFSLPSLFSLSPLFIQPKEGRTGSENRSGHPSMSEVTKVTSSSHSAHFIVFFKPVHLALPKCPHGQSAHDPKSSS